MRLLRDERRQQPPSPAERRTQTRKTKAPRPDKAPPKQIERAPLLIPSQKVRRDSRKSRPTRSQSRRLRPANPQPLGGRAFCCSRICPAHPPERTHDVICFLQP